MSESRQIIRLHHVEKRYHGVRTLFVDELVIRSGEFIVIQGPNGAGKSTLLRLIAGAIRPDAGTIERDADGARRSTRAVIPQKGGLYRDLSLKENLRLYSGLYERKTADLDGGRYVRAMGLVPFLDRRFSELSGGFQRLAVIAAALGVVPDELLADEPLSGLDQNFATAVKEHLLIYRGRSRLLIISTPQPDTLPGADRVIRVEGGQVR